jgi:hypothetical protein
MWKRTAAALTAALGLTAQTIAQSPTPVQPVPGPMPMEETPASPSAPAVGPTGLIANAPCDGCASNFQERWWVSADYLVGWIRGTNLPPLVTTSPIGTPQASAGVLGGSTTVLYGFRDVDDSGRPGLRVGLGGWLDADRTVGIDAGFFVLSSQNSIFFASSPDGSAILARPFTDVTTGLQNAQLISFPGVASGSINASMRVNDFYSGNFDFQEAFLTDSNFRLESILGYRFLRYNDRLAIDQDTTVISSPILAAGTKAAISDRFTAENSFNGGEAGLRMQFQNDMWTADLGGKIAVGNIHRSVGIAGTTTTSAPGSAPGTNPGGLLALSSNTGVFETNDWTFVPECDVTVGWRITPNLQLRVGYTLIYWPDVARANNQVNLNINPALIPPPIAGASPLAPTFQLQKSDLLIQTINLGLEVRF